MSRRRTSYRRQKEETALTRKREALASPGVRGAHDLWNPLCVQQRLDGHQGPYCLGCEVLRAALRAPKPSEK